MWVETMTVFARVYSGVHEHFPARRSEWVMALAMITWGCILAGPDDIFSRTPAWSAMAAIMTEDHWAWMAISVGTLRVGALVVNGTFSKTQIGRYSPHLRAFTSFLCCGVWFQIFFGIVSSPSANTGMAMYGAALVLDILNVFASVSDAGQVDGAHENGCA